MGPDVVKPHVLDSRGLQRTAEVDKQSPSEIPYTGNCLKGVSTREPCSQTPWHPRKQGGASTSPILQSLSVSVRHERFSDEGDNPRDLAILPPDIHLSSSRFILA